jgi:hypothetical protein
MADNQDDKKVKDLIDAATRAELERWFKLPSFDQQQEQAQEQAAQPANETKAAKEAERLAIRKRYDAAIAAVDPAMLEAHHRRTAPLGEVSKFKPVIDVRVDPSIVQIDLALIERQHSVAEPRDFERPAFVEDDLQERTPQALLRDLHRPETDFYKTFEMVDMSAEQRFDIVAAVAQAMATRWTLPPLGKSPFHEAREALREGREYRRRPWADIKMPNRRVTG